MGSFSEHSVFKQTERVNYKMTAATTITTSSTTDDIITWVARN